MSPEFYSGSHLLLKFLDDEASFNSYFTNVLGDDPVAMHHLQNQLRFPIRLGIGFLVLIDHSPGRIHLPDSSGGAPIGWPIFKIKTFAGELRLCSHAILLL